LLEGEKQNQVAGTSEKIDLDEIMRKFDVEARYRTLSGWQALLVSVIAVAMSLFHLYTSGMGLLLAIKQGAVHLAFALGLIFLLYPASNKGRKDSIPWYDMVWLSWRLCHHFTWSSFSTNWSDAQGCRRQPT